MFNNPSEKTGALKNTPQNFAGGMNLTPALKLHVNPVAVTCALRTRPVSLPKGYPCLDCSYNSGTPSKRYRLAGAVHGHLFSRFCQREPPDR